MKHDAIIFDVDGTLWNACPATAKGWNMALDTLGIAQQISSGDIEGVVGKPFDECVAALFPRVAVERSVLMEMLDEYEKQVVELEGGRLYDGVQEGIKELSKHYVIFLVSNCQDWYLGTFLKFSGIEPYLKGFDCYGMSGVPKYQMLIDMKGRHQLQNPVYIGDTEGDAEAAEKSGIDFQHVGYGFGENISHPSFATFPELVSHFSEEVA